MTKNPLFKVVDEFFIYIETRCWNVRWARYKKGSYFFVIDAFIAGIIILSGVAVLFAQFLETPVKSTAFFSAEDFFAVLESTEIRNYDDAKVNNWTLNGTINDSRVSLLYQFALFNVTGRNYEGKELADIVVRSLPSNVGAEMIIADTTYGAKMNESKNESPIFFSAKRILLVRNVPSEIYPPVVIEVQTWQ